MARGVSIFWFRRDLRIDDNAGFFKALTSGNPVLPVFIFDTEILRELPRDDARVNFIFQRLTRMRKALEAKHGRSLAIYYGKPAKVFKQILSEWEVRAVFTNRDYEPYAQSRDQEVKAILDDSAIPFHTFKDQVIFEKSEVVKDDGHPYVVYTPYKRRWKALLEEKGVPASQPSQENLHHIVEGKGLPSVTLEELGFETSSITVPDFDLSEALIGNYGKTRDIPSRDGTSHLGPHLRFGTISIRKALKAAMAAADQTFWDELIWREFFMQILWHFPHTVNTAFKAPYDRIQWRNDRAEFEKWKTGKTGYALVDAGMRQLNKTGYMHNRVRMLVASFLCKHLLIDWRWGEAYFAEKLLDFELSSNVGNWQWAAGSGVDAAPYFRIFNPMTQVSKFDRDHTYIRTWVPEFDSEAYPGKMVDHKEARERCLRTYKAALEA